MTVPANDTLELTGKARAALDGELFVAAQPPPFAAWCSSLWDSTDQAVRHQCVRGLHHAGACRCICGVER